jgi:hypothetical protein
MLCQKQIAFAADKTVSDSAADRPSATRAALRPVIDGLASWSR